MIALKVSRLSSKPLLFLRFVALLAVLGNAPRFVSEPWTDTAPQLRSQAALQSVMMKGHNDARGALKVAPLRWSPQLAQNAKAYASELARTDSFQHSAGVAGREPEGENLWMGTRGAFGYTSMIGSWVGERRVYRPGPIPNVSTTGDFEDVGHYTQIIWRGTKLVGCAISASAHYEYLVCRYWPAGNVEDSHALD